MSGEETPKDFLIEPIADDKEYYKIFHGNLTQPTIMINLEMDSF